jgi:hypothetical protein
VLLRPELIFCALIAHGVVGQRGVEINGSYSIDAFSCRAWRAGDEITGSEGGDPCFHVSRGRLAAPKRRARRATK